jgi:Phospholipase_D-nuclease N-terminal
VLAYDYPLLGVFWSLVLFSFAVLIVFAVIWAFIDNFRRRDHGGLAKALWALFILFLPLFGVFCYLIARPVDPDAEVVVYEQGPASRP